jgi:hypothetical protein
MVPTHLAESKEKRQIDLKVSSVIDEREMRLDPKVSPRRTLRSKGKGLDSKVSSVKNKGK